jgi:hypothetical protein
VNETHRRGAVKESCAETCEALEYRLDESNPPPAS